MSYDRTAKNGKIKKMLDGIIVVELIVCYMAILTLISHVRGPERYRIDPAGQKWAAADFSCFDGMGLSKIQEDSLHLENSVSGNHVVFQTELQLEAMSGYQVSFWFDSSEEFQGNHLAVDLYNEEAGYDENSMEYMHTLTAGRNEVKCELFPDENAPSTAQLRIFTADTVKCDLNDLRVCTLQKIPKVSAVMKMVTFFVLLIFGLTLGFWYLQKRSKINHATLDKKGIE